MFAVLLVFTAFLTIKSIAAIITKRKILNTVNVSISTSENKTVL
jgi:hypothetical protein